MSKFLNKVQSGFLSLRGSPSELWKAYLLKFLDSYSYFSFSIIFTLFLSDDFGYSDVAAGTLYGIWGAMVTVYGILSGWIIDNLGVAKSLRLGFFLALLSRFSIFATNSRVVLLLNVCGLLPFSACLRLPVLTAGIRRYTKETNRGFAFGLFYVIMNVASLLSGILVDAFTIWYNRDDEDVEHSPGWSLTSYRVIILSGVVANIFACLVTLTIREIKVVSSDDDKCLPLKPRIHQEHNGLEENDENSSACITEFELSRGKPIDIWKEVLQTKSFWRFLAVCLITLNLRMIFRHLDATLPKYMVREFGENTPKGTIYSINPALIIFLVPLLTAATTKINPLVMIHHGSYISAISVFCLVISTSIPACILFVIVLSIGEAMWSPRFYDYTMSVVKEGREGTYMALSSAPLFLAKLPVGVMSGYLLQKYCPEEGERQSKMMWLIIGLTTAVSPILLTLCWGYVSQKDEDESKQDEFLDSNVRNNCEEETSQSNVTSNQKSNQSCRGGIIT